MEALRLVGVESDLLDDRLLPERLGEVLAFDLIVLVRRRTSPQIKLLLEFSEAHGLPVVYELDDYLFDEEVVPHSEFLRTQPIEAARFLVNEYRDLVLSCRYYTGTTSYLVDLVAALGVSSYCIPNGLNTVQIEKCRIARETIEPERGRVRVWLGYFSGSRTHQADFGLIVPVLVRLLSEYQALGLVVAGDLDLTQFQKFAPVIDRIDQRPFVDWTLLPDEIARVDINLIPLVLNPFTEAKSDLKYYEAAVLGVPSVASPTGAFRACITHGSNGFLAFSPDEWYTHLRALIDDPGLRRLMGQRAYDHAMRNYVPAMVGEQAKCVYREILLEHRRGLGVDDESVTVVVHFSDLSLAIEDRSPALTLCSELARAGAKVTIYLDPRPTGFGAEDARLAVIEFLGEEPELSYQVGGEVPCADILVVTDAATALHAWESKKRARWTVYLVCEYQAHLLVDEPGTVGAIRATELGLDMLVVDPVVADLLAKHGCGKVIVAPTQSRVDPRDVSLHSDPDTILVVSGNRATLPEIVWTEVALALEQVRADHHSVRVVLGGAAASRWKAMGTEVSRIDQLDEENLLASLAHRPVCVLLCPVGSFPRLLDFLAAGCPTIVVNIPGERNRADAELTRGAIEVRADALEIARAIDSLLVDRVRLGSLSFQAAEYQNNLSRPADLAYALIEHFRTACDQVTVSSGSPKCSRRSDGIFQRLLS
jgi:glycosyltransferase involved in cell wall biosynthesis